MDNFHSSYTGGTQEREEKACLRESSSCYTMHPGPECAPARPGVPRGALLQVPSPGPGWAQGHVWEALPGRCSQRTPFLGRNGADKLITLPPLQNKLRERGIESSHTCVSAHSQGPGTPDFTPADPQRRETSACPEPPVGAWGCPGKPPQPHHMYRSRPAGKLGCLT